MEVLMNELKHLRSPWKEVVSKWKMTSIYRTKNMMSNEDTNLCNILEKWPLYQHAQAPELVIKI